MFGGGKDYKRISTNSDLVFIGAEITEDHAYRAECKKKVGEDCDIRSDTLHVVDGKGAEAQNAEIKFGDQSSDYAVCGNTELGERLVTGSFQGNGKIGPTICIFGERSLANKVLHARGEPKLPEEPKAKTDKPDKKVAELSPEERKARLTQVGQDPRIKDAFDQLPREGKIEAIKFARKMINEGLSIEEVIKATISKINEIELAMFGI